MKTFLKHLFCNHYWTHSISEMPVPGVLKVGFKDWRTNESYWGCRKCGKVKKFEYRFIPLNWEGK